MSKTLLPVPFETASVSLVSTFATAILPVVAVAAAGYLLGRVEDVDVGALNTVTIYVLLPALVFHSLATSDIAGRVALQLTGGVVGFVGAMTLLAEGVGRALGEPEPLHSAFVLESAFPNSGNLGIPLCAFAFGAVGRSTAVLYLTVQSVLAYTLGVYVASRSGGARGFGAARRVFAIPLVYAVAAALGARWLGLVPPSGSTAMETLKLVGDAAIPVMLLLLGVELANTDPGVALRRVGPVNVMKLGVAPLVGLGVALAVGLEGTVGRTFVLECATPAAVTPLILVLEFSGGASTDGISAAEYVSTAVLTTTLLSLVTLTLLIAALESGVLL